MRCRGQGAACREHRRVGGVLRASADEEEVTAVERPSRISGAKLAVVLAEEPTSATLTLVGSAVCRLRVVPTEPLLVAGATVPMPTLPFGMIVMLWLITPALVVKNRRSPVTLVPEAAVMKDEISAVRFSLPAVPSLP